MPPQNLSLWQKDYFELEAIKNQQMQKDAFQGLPLSDQKHLTGDSLCPRRWRQVGVKMNLHNPLPLLPLLSPYIYFCYYLNVCVPPTPKVIYGSPNSRCDGRGGAFGRQRGHDSGTHMDGITAVTKETRERTARRWACVRQKGTLT